MSWRVTLITLSTSVLLLWPTSCSLTLSFFEKKHVHKQPDHSLPSMVCSRHSRLRCWPKTRCYLHSPRVQPETILTLMRTLERHLSLFSPLLVCCCFLMTPAIVVWIAKGSHIYFFHHLRKKNFVNLLIGHELIGLMIKYLFVLLGLPVVGQINLEWSCQYESHTSETFSKTFKVKKIMYLKIICTSHHKSSAAMWAAYITEANFM